MEFDVYEMIEGEVVLTGDRKTVKAMEIGDIFIENGFFKQKTKHEKNKNGFLIVEAETMFESEVV